MNIFELIGAVSDIAIALAAVVTAIVAFPGLNAWRREMSGKAGFDAARSLARATYFLRDSMEHCRSPVISQYEFPHDFDPLRNSTQKEAVRAWLHVYQNRMAPVREALHDFDVASVEAEVLWGSDVKVAAESLRECVRDLDAAIESFMRDKHSGGEDFRSDRDFSRRVREYMYTVNQTDNELSMAVERSVRQIESFFRQHLS